MEAPEPHKDANLPLKDTPKAHKNATCLSRHMCLTRTHMYLTWKHLSLIRMPFKEAHVP